MLIIFFKILRIILLAPILVLLSAIGVFVTFLIDGPEDALDLMKENSRHDFIIILGIDDITKR